MYIKRIETQKIEYKEECSTDYLKGIIKDMKWEDKYALEGTPNIEIEYLICDDKTDECIFKTKMRIKA